MYVKQAIAYSRTMETANGATPSPNHEVCLAKLQGYLAVTELKEECLAGPASINPSTKGWISLINVM